MKIAITNQKGGVGKTTTAVNLAGALAQEGRRTLLIDLDSQANATAALGVEVDDASVRELISEDQIDPYPTTMDNLLVLPATVDLAGAETYLARNPDAQILARATRHYDDAFEFIIFDCPPSLGHLTIAALTAADYAIIPIEAGIWEMQGLARLVQVLDATDTELLGILLTRYDKRLGISSDTHNQLVKSDLPIFDVKIFERVAVKYAAIARQTILQHDPASDVAHSYRRLAREVIDHAT